MRVTNELDLPIRPMAVSGPAVDALDKRKEHSSNPRIEALELRESFNNLKEGLFAGIKELSRVISNELASQRRGRSGG
jgi:hypothetical protein